MNHEKDAIVGELGGSKIAVQTTAGAAWAKKVLHPPSAISSDYYGTPDASNPNVVLLEVKGETNITPLLNVKALDKSATTVWCDAMMFVIPSGGHVAAYVLHRYDGAWYSSNLNNNVRSQSTKPAVLNSGYNFTNLAQDASLVSTAYKSTTFYLNATNFNNQGTVTTAKFKPNILYSNTASAVAQKYGIDTLLALKDHMINNNVNNVHDRNITVIDDHIDSNYKYGEFDHFFQILNMGINDNAGTVYSKDTESTCYGNAFPATASDLMMISPKATTRQAKDGTFVVQQMNGPVRVWNEVPSPNLDQLNQRMVHTLMRIVINNKPYILPLVSANDNNAGYYYSDTPWSNLDFSLVLFEGLSIGTGSGLSGGPYVTVKSFTGLEIQPQMNSSLLSFQRLLPKFDPVALEFCNHIFHGMPDGAPASANDNDSIMSVIKKHLPGIVESTKAIYGSAKNAKAVRPELKKKLNELTAQLSKIKVSTSLKQRKLPLKSAKPLPSSSKKIKKKTINSEKPQINNNSKMSKL
jgi:hypothetical protein